MQTPILPRTNNADHRLPKFTKILTTTPTSWSSNLRNYCYQSHRSSRADCLWWNHRSSRDYLWWDILSIPQHQAHSWSGDWKKVNRVRKMMSSSTKVMAAVAAGRNPWRLHPRRSLRRLRRLRLHERKGEVGYAQPDYYWFLKCLLCVCVFLLFKEEEWYHLYFHFTAWDHVLIQY